MQIKSSLKKSGKWTIEIIAIIGIVLGISAWQTRDMLAADGSVALTNPNLVSIEGEVLPLLASDKRTLVYFWAPWCNICSVSIGSLENVDAASLNIVTVAMDYDSLESVEKFVSEHAVESKVLLGNEQLKRQFQILGYPSYYLVDEDAKVVAKSFGLNTSIGIRLKDWLSR